MLLICHSVARALRPDPDQARSWVERELGRPEYQQGLLERFYSWLGDLWDELTRAALGASSLSTGVAVVVLAALLALALVAAGRVRNEPRGARRRPDDDVLWSEDSPDAHRAAARRSLEDGDPSTALVEAFRAIAVRAARRGLLRVRPGLTAHEVAAELRGVFPGRADDLADAAALFDRVFYGDQPAEPDDARAVLRLDQVLDGERPRLLADGAGVDR